MPTSRTFRVCWGVTAAWGGGVWAGCTCFRCRGGVAVGCVGRKHRSTWGDVYVRVEENGHTSAAKEKMGVLKGILSCFCAAFK